MIVDMTKRDPRLKDPTDMRSNIAAWNDEDELLYQLDSGKQTPTPTPKPKDASLKPRVSNSQKPSTLMKRMPSHRGRVDAETIDRGDEETLQSTNDAEMEAPHRHRYEAYSLLTDEFVCWCGKPKP